ncbi:MAG: ssDNA endonuclease and repair protein rad10, partial [Candelina submexicana]
MSSEPRSDMSKPNILQALPTETLLHVCSYLDKKDIKTARLICKAFNDCCEEFLIDRAVIAARYNTLEVLKQIASHPVFSRTVKTVVFDLSSFEQVLTNKDKYVDRFQGMAYLRPHRERMLITERLRGESRASLDDPSLASRPYGWTFARLGYLKYCQLYQDQEEIRSQGLDHLILAAVLQKLPNVKELIYDDDPRHGPLVVDIHPMLKNWCVDPSKLSRSWEATPDVAGRYAGLSQGIRALAPHSVDLSSLAPFNRGILQTIMARPLADSSSHNLDFNFPTLSSITIDCSVYWTEVFKTGIPPDVQADFLAAFRNIKRIN